MKQQVWYYFHRIIQLARYYTGSSRNVEEEDMIMIDSVTVTHEEDLDDEPSNYQVHFAVDQDRLNQVGDAIDDDSDENSLASDSEDDSDYDSTLLSIAPKSPASRRASVIPQMAKKKRLSKVVQKPCGKYMDYDSDQLRDRALKLLGSGWSYRDIERDLGVPKSTMSDHNKRYRTRGGNPTPRKQKGPKLSKISQDGSKFLVETVLEKENTATLL